MAGPPHNSRSKARIAAEASKCVDLKASGMTYKQVAAEMGYANQATAFERVQLGLSLRINPAVDRLRQLQDAELEEMAGKLKEIADNAEDSDLRMRAYDRWLKVMDRRAKLHGLDAPVKVDATVTQQTQQEKELEAMFADLDAANTKVSEELNS